MGNTKVTVTEGHVKKEFTTVGLIYIVYLLTALFINNIVGEYLFAQPIGHIDDVNYLYIVIGIRYAVILLGSFIPFVLLARHNNLRTSEIFRTPNISLFDILIRTVILIVIAEIVIFLLTIINTNLPIEGEVLYPIGLSKDESYFSNYLYLVLFVIATPIVEEYIFRGVLLKTLGNYGLYFGMVTSSVLYGLATESIGEIILAFVVGLYLARTTLRYNSTVPAVFMHILFNAYFATFFALMNTKNGRFIPYVILGVIIIFVIIMLVKRFETFRIKRDTQFGYVCKLFYTRVSVIIGIILAIVYPIIRTIILIVEKSST